MGAYRASIPLTFILKTECVDHEKYQEAPQEYTHGPQTNHNGLLIHLHRRGGVISGLRECPPYCPPQDHRHGIVVD